MAQFVFLEQELNSTAGVGDSAPATPYFKKNNTRQKKKKKKKTKQRLIRHKGSRAGVPHDNDDPYMTAYRRPSLQPRSAK